MNKTEYWNSKNRNNTYFKYVHRLLETWKVENNITERCVVHHRDDNDEVRAYNKAFYERWGCNEDGTKSYNEFKHAIKTGDITFEMRPISVFINQ